MIVNLLNDLETKGDLKRLLTCGLISPKVIFYREAYLRFRIHVDLHKQSVSVAISEVAEELRVNERTVRRAISCMTSTFVA